MNTARIYSLAAAYFFVFCLSACGQKGALRLPEKTPAEQQQNSPTEEPSANSSSTQDR